MTPKTAYYAFLFKNMNKNEARIQKFPSPQQTGTGTRTGRPVKSRRRQILPGPAGELLVGAFDVVGARNQVAGALVVVNARAGVVVRLGHAALFHHRVGHGDGGEQAAGVGVYRVGKDFIGGAGLQQVAQMQHADAVADVLDHGQVVGDEEIGGAGLGLDVLHQVDHLGLDGDVQRRDALIGNDELGVHDEGAGNAHALALAAGELVGIALGVFGGQTHLGQNFLHLLLPLGAGGIHMVDVQPLGDDVTHLFAGVEGRHGVLENHLHLGAQMLALAAGQPAADVLPVKQDGTPGGVVQADDAAADGGLAGAGFAHKAVGLAGINLKAHVVHRLDGEVLVDAEILLEPAHLEQRRGLGLCHVTAPPFPCGRLRPSCGQCGPAARAASPPWGPGGPAARWRRSGCRSP